VGDRDGGAGAGFDLRARVAHVARPRLEVAERVGRAAGTVDDELDPEALAELAVFGAEASAAAPSASVGT
jgi:hypothetical protein